MNVLNVSIGQKPRMTRNGDKTGNYSVVHRLSKSHVDPGEDLLIEIYFSGYGEISTPKVVIYPSSPFFNPEESFMKCNILQEDGKVFFGGEKIKMDEVGATIILKGLINQPHWTENTMFFDIRKPNDNSIFTETKQIGAPVELNYKIKKDCRPGVHYVIVVFTYYDGDKWKTSSSKFEFNVTTFFQRYELLVWSLGLLVTVLTLPVVINSAYQMLANFFTPLFLCS
jgi:hypothetical protein